MWSFWTGQKVVCVNDKWDPTRKDKIIRPVINQTYTIREIHRTFANPNQLCFLLVEIVNEPQNYIGGITECRFYASHFRPLKDTKSDISLLQKLRDPEHKIKDPKRIKESA